MFFTLLCSREADDVKEQSDKKCRALNAADPGSDLLSVQALQRQHEVFERDIIPLGEKVRHMLSIFFNTFSIFIPIAMYLFLFGSLGESIILISFIF